MLTWIQNLFIKSFYNYFILPSLFFLNKETDSSFSLLCTVNYGIELVQVIPQE